MKPKNPKLMYALIGLGVVVLFGFVYSITHSAGGQTQNINSATNPNSSSIASYDYQSGDTNTEVLNTVVAKQKELEEKNTALTAKNEQLEQQQQQKESQGIAQVQNSFTTQLDEIAAKLQSEISTQHNSISVPPTSTNAQNNSGYLVNGTAGTFDSSSQNAGVIGSVNDISQAFVSPVTQGAGGNNVAAVFGAANAQNNSPVLPSDASNNQKSQPKPMYMIPDGATIGSIYMMTATLAEVPVSGRLIAPAWPFKAIIGSQDLMGTNSQMLPSQIAGAVIQGHAIGNMGLGCATLYVDKITYTFPNGHFWVYPNDSDSNDNSDGKQVYPSHSLGMLTLPDGTQCINGLYLTDAPKVLLNLAALGAASNAGNVMANQQISTVSNGLTGVTGTNITGSAGKLFGYSMLAGSGTAALDYYQARVSDVFDAIFLPASANHEPTKLMFNVQKNIPIDYDPNMEMNASKNSMSSNLNNLD